MRIQDRSLDHEVARLAGRQHGVITFEQLVQAGMSSAGVARRVRKGTLHREYRGVYRVGHRAPSTLARYTAAVLACGSGALLSGMAAGSLFGLVRGAPPRPEVSTTADRRIPGVITRRVRSIHRREVTVYQGIPVTTVPRTLVDVAASLSFDELSRACHDAEVRYGVRPKAVFAVLARRPRVRGAAKLREVFQGQGITLSDLERRFLALLRSERLPLPITNKVAHRRYVDCRWPDYRLTVELDSYTYHHTRHAWEQDRRRERLARAAATNSGVTRTTT